MLWRLGAAWALLLAGCGPAVETFTLRFPDGVSLGELRLVEDVNCFTCGTGSSELGAARGTHEIKLPHGWYVSLTPPKEASRLLPYLDEPSMSRIGELRLQGSDVTDADLSHLSSLKLRSLDLSGTGIDGSGLAHIQGDPHWLFLTVVGCPNLKVEQLARFKTNKRLTIRLTSSRYDRKPEGRERELLERARQVVCDGRDEQACGIQLR
jgi:hypothetical protein